MEWHDAGEEHRRLYIPFWLYSNQVQNVVIVLTIPLYIPFWLYSN